MDTVFCSTDRHLLPLFYKWWNWASEKFSHFSKVNRERGEINPVLSPSLCSVHSDPDSQDYSSGFVLTKQSLHLSSCIESLTFLNWRPESQASTLGSQICRGIPRHSSLLTSRLPAEMDQWVWAGFSNGSSCSQSLDSCSNSCQVDSLKCTVQHSHHFTVIFSVPCTFYPDPSRVRKGTMTYTLSPDREFDQSQTPTADSSRTFSEQER